MKKRARRAFSDKDLATITKRFTTTDDTIAAIAKDLKRDPNTLGVKIASMGLKRGAVSNGVTVKAGEKTFYTVIANDGFDTEVTDDLTLDDALRLVNDTLAAGRMVKLVQEVPIKLTAELR